MCSILIYILQNDAGSREGESISNLGKKCIIEFTNINLSFDD